ncbi:hypothetical protein NW762_008199 [Fusarium torreyae]|uniref:BTB domain-containing protein n=1 Tax=Fusarium torreyae TaxID=1237075 RepID=A0A9W8RVV4_9HYPO|nr:hypothetical protein NW762_008199 [Fusarium torreyae]
MVHGKFVRLSRAQSNADKFKESSERVIYIEDFDASIVEAMVNFMYSFDYTDAPDSPLMVFNAQVYQIADKYDISALKSHAKSKFGTAINSGWTTEDFPIAINVAYTTTPPEDRGLRDLIVEIAPLAKKPTVTNANIVARPSSSAPQAHKFSTALGVGGLAGWVASDEFRTRNRPT